ncbi:ciliary-associated calcium-binding coiled-coil protein 1-like isoform X2 [Physella acuta]|uniref:ciliary-associated calcium-binding coiled-coil protein 1-like isoform X2 n=1 Tax=Physella acuta TaxID=109671 RepID=UPI0027DCF8BF|nr:ciliary-associated calcium-binding coiled-coil protein 1-like isoform X2 [Physella acuta]
MSKTKGKTQKSREGLSKDNQDDESQHKKSIVPFSILPDGLSDQLLKLGVEDIEKQIEKLFELKPELDLKDAAILDYYVGAAYWAKQQGFDSLQLSGFFTVAHQLLYKIKDEKSSLVGLFKELHHRMIGVGSEYGEMVTGLESFNVSHAKQITDYIYSSLFQHFKLYQFMFLKEQLEEVIGCELLVEVPLPSSTPFPPPLDEALMEPIYKEYLLMPIQTEKEQEGIEPPVSPPGEVSLPDNVEDIFAKLSPEDVQAIIEEMAQEVLQTLHAGIENKIKIQETTALAKINKIHNVLQQESKVETSEP